MLAQFGQNNDGRYNINNTLIFYHGVFTNSYILRVVLVIIMEFHWFIGRVLYRRAMYHRGS